MSDTPLKLKENLSIKSQTDKLASESMSKLKLQYNKTAKENDEPQANSLKIGIPMIKKESYDSKKTFNNVSSSEDEDFTDDSDFFSDEDYDDEDSVYEMSVDPSKDSSMQQKQDSAVRFQGND